MNKRDFDFSNTAPVSASVKSLPNVVPQTPILPTTPSTPLKYLPTPPDPRTYKPVDSPADLPPLPKFAFEPPEGDQSLNVEISSGIWRETDGQADSAFKPSQRDADQTQSSNIVLLFPLPPQIQSQSAISRCVAYLRLPADAELCVASAGEKLSFAVLRFKSKDAALAFRNKPSLNLYGKRVNIYFSDAANVTLTALSLIADLVLNQKTVRAVGISDDQAPRFGGGLSKTAPAVHPKFSFKVLRKYGKDSDEENYWRDLGAQAVEFEGQVATIRFLRAQAREAVLVTPVISVSAVGGEYQVAKAKDGRVAIFC